MAGPPPTYADALLDETHDASGPRSEATLDAPETTAATIDLTDTGDDGHGQLMEVVVEPNTGDWRERNGRVRRNRERGRWTRQERRQRREERGERQRDPTSAGRGRGGRFRDGGLRRTGYRGGHVAETQARDGGHRGGRGSRGGRRGGQGRGSFELDLTVLSQLIREGGTVNVNYNCQVQCPRD